MKTLNEQIERLRELVRKCYGVVASKNGEVPSDKTMENLPDAIASTHDTLEELTITANGTYTPQDGVDGFNKVVANVVPKEKVKVQQFKVSNACINDDGIWEENSLIDTSEVTSLNQVFYNCSKLKYINATSWDTSKVTNMNSMFSNCTNLETLDLSSWDVSNVVTLQGAFNNCSKLKSINTDGWDTSKVTNLNSTFFGISAESLNLSHWNTSNVTTINLMFTSCRNLKHVNTYGWNTSNIINTARPFNNCINLESVDFRTWNAGKMTNLTNDANGLFHSSYNLTTFIGGVGIDEVITNNVTALNGAKVNINISQLGLLDRASLRALINGLADLTGQTAQTLTLGATLMAKLTEEDIAIATNKNWTIV